MEKTKQDLAYYVTLFKTEGHSTWRAHLGATIGAFEKQKSNDGWPTVTDTKIFRVDRLSGTIDLLP